MFDIATRKKFRFDTVKGFLTVEDLWDLPLSSTTGKTNLDDIARGLHKQLKNGDDVSFVHADKKSDEIVQLKFDIVKHIIDVKLAENAAEKIARDNATKKQRLLEIIADREDDQLKSLSIDELKKAVAAL